MNTTETVNEGSKPCKPSWMPSIDFDVLSVCAEVYRTGNLVISHDQAYEIAKSYHGDLTQVMIRANFLGVWVI